MELLLVLDRSGSMRHSMQTLLSTAQDLVGDFEIGPTLTRVGVVQFNADAQVLLSLSDNAAAIDSAIGGGGPSSSQQSLVDTELSQQDMRNNASPPAQYR